MVSIERPSLGGVEFYLMATDDSLYPVSELNISAALPNLSPHFIFEPNTPSRVVFAKISSPYVSTSEVEIIPYSNYVKNDQCTTVFHGSVFWSNVPDQHFYVEYRSNFKAHQFARRRWVSVIFGTIICCS